MYLTGEQSRWRALIQAFTGNMAALEGPIDLVLALSDARDTDSFHRLIEVYGSLPLTRRVQLLKDVRPRHYEAECLSTTIGRLLTLRNRLAHAWIDEATEDQVILTTTWRGNHNSLKLTQHEMTIALTQVQAAQHSINRMLNQVGDLTAWGQIMGLTEETTPHTRRIRRQPKPLIHKRKHHSRRVYRN